ncbi:hypothetical protein GOP47_0017946 [Adiantum capillus-veneris]|uniref:CRAL-TRIO domain-containing protein n=1 Tax=Adiantum capillus-veneris TaxID=13818 RepID=A0A9D4Z9P3_ADICA|nr:hypothetical protein GOP47_0017946 [Adiantum capillus-veneris]
MATTDPPLPLSTLAVESEPVPSTDATPPAATPTTILAAENPIASAGAQPTGELPISDGLPPATESYVAQERSLPSEASVTSAGVEAESPTIEPTDVIEERSLPTEAPAATINPASTTAEVENPLPVTPQEIRDCEPPPLETHNTIEESFYLKDLKESQKQALLQLKAKIEAAIITNTFLDPLRPAKTEKEEKKEETEAKEEKKEEAEESEKTEENSTDAPSSDAVISDTITESSRDIALEPTAENDVIGTSNTDKTPEPIPTEEVHGDGDESPSLDDLALWGIPLLHSKGDKRTDVLLLKFLRARDFKVEKAVSMLQDTMAWRKEFNTDGLIEEETPADFHGSFIHGTDLEGHPVCYNGELSSKKSVEDEAQLKKRIQVLEKGIQRLDFSANGVNSMVQVIDFTGHSPSFLGRGLRSKILDVLQNNYPELVSKQIFINVPWYFPPLLSLFNSRTRSKAVVAKPGRVAETLFKYISPDQVPVQYGGLSRLDDSAFIGIDAPTTQVVVKAGETRTIELPVPDAGKVVWDISVIGWEVLYEEEFVPEKGYIRIIRKASRKAANEEPLHNTYVADAPGKMVLTINNTTSRRRRMVVYRYAVIPS